jgi:glutaredoxin
MSNKPEIIIYTLENCPNCELLKDYLREKGAAFDLRDMQDPAALTELRINAVFVREAPVLQKGKTFLTSADLFAKGAVKEDALDPILKGE